MRGCHAAFIWILVVVMIIQSCSESKHQDDLKADQPINAWIGKKIIFPDKLKLLEDSIFYPVNTFVNANRNKRKIISIVDGSCSKCILGQLNKIDSVLSLLIKGDTNTVATLVLNVDSQDSASFMIALYPLIKAKNPILWDGNFSFESENDIFTQFPEQRTFMTDDNSHIVLIGNPLYSEEVKELYKRYLLNL